MGKLVWKLIPPRFKNTTATTDVRGPVGSCPSKGEWSMATHRATEVSGRRKKKGIRGGILHPGDHLASA